MLSRMGFLTLRDGSLEIKGENKPELSELKSVLANEELQFEMKNFHKPDYYTSFPFIEGIITADNYKT